MMALRTDALPRRRRLHRATSLSPRRVARPPSPPSPPSSPPPPPPRLLDRDELRCAICFDLLSFPVTLPCGHNFDRGCLLTAWAHEIESATLDAHACPLCRHRALAVDGDELRVNLLLKKLIMAQFPDEIHALERDATKHKATPIAMVPPSPVASPPSERRTGPWRTAASFLSVWLASVTEPPGFVLAVLLLLSLLALAVTPQQMLTNASTLPTLFEALDHALNAFLLLVREIAARADALDLAAWRVLQAVAVFL